MRRAWRVLLGVSLLFNALVFAGGAIYVAQRGGMAYLSAKLGGEAARPAGLYEIRQSMFRALPTEQVAVVLLGDSLTAHAEWHELLPEIDVVNRGIAGDTTTGVLKRLDEVVSLHPQAVFVMVGVNDLRAGLTVDSVVERYELILGGLRRGLPDASLVVEAILYTNDRLLSIARPGNDHIEAVNRQLQRLADKYGAAYLDLNDELAPDNVLGEQFTIDGLHVNGNGYQVWSHRMRAYL